MNKKIIRNICIVSGVLIGVSLTLWQLNPKDINLRPASFDKLPGWKSAEVSKSFLAFQNSCRTFLRQQPEGSVGSQQIQLKVKDWVPACKVAMQMNPVSESSARKFFKEWFTPVEFYNRKSISGLFTGYYLPLLQGSLVKTSKFNVPIYGLPNNIITINPANFGLESSKTKLIGRLEGNKVLPYYTRAQINKGAIEKNAPVLVWVSSHIDRLFLEIQGSGMIKLPDGKKMYLGYAGENGAPYTPVGNVLVKKGIMTRATASMQSIKAYLQAHPKEILPTLDQNASFVFFRTLEQTAALGAQGVNLTAGYSLAIDRKWIPLGVPLWLDTTRPDKNSDKPQVFQRLMIAQDTGGAIRGAVRGDVFWGAGKEATYIAGNMKNEGHYWLLLPRHRVAELPKT
jgi:membrane-bound lytic murein transglycosylase A